MSRRAASLLLVLSSDLFGFLCPCFCKFALCYPGPNLVAYSILLQGRGEAGTHWVSVVIRSILFFGVSALLIFHFYSFPFLIYSLSL